MYRIKSSPLRLSAVGNKKEVFMKKLVFVVAVAVMVLSAGVACAEEVNLNDALIGIIQRDLMPLLIAFITSLVSLILLKVKKKLNLQVSAETEAWIQGQAEHAVQLVAEKAAARINAGQVKFTKNEKLDMAIAALIQKAPEVSRPQADQYIHAALSRMFGEGATGDKQVVAAE